MSCATTNQQSHSTKKQNKIPLIFVDEFLKDTGSKYTIVPKYFKQKNSTGPIHVENKKSNNINLMALNYSLSVKPSSYNLHNQTQDTRKEGIKLEQEKGTGGYQTSQTELILIIAMVAFIMITIIIMFAIRLNQKAQYQITVTTDKDDFTRVSEPSMTGYQDDSSYIGPYGDRQSI